MGSLVFQATLGGQVNLNGPNTASTFDIAVPATTGTMVTTGDSGTVTNTMLAASAYNTPGTIGSGTANTGAFTTLAASSTVSGTGFSTYLASPPAIGGTAAAAGTFTTLSGTTSVTTQIVKSASSLTLQSNGTTTAVTVDTSQNVGIGTSSPGNRLDVRSSTTGVARLQANGATSTSVFANTILALASNGSGADATLNFTDSTAYNSYIGAASGSLYFATNGTSERMRIDSSGNLLLGGTQVGQSGLFNSYQVNGSGAYNTQLFNGYSSGTSYFIEFLKRVSTTNTTVGSITYNGTNTLYNITSDARLKKNIVDAPSAISLINQIKIRSFDWKDSNAHVDYGVIAQELFEVEPTCVSEGDTSDEIEKTWGVDTSILVPALIKSIQEQQALIASLTDRIAALEAK